MKKKNISPDLDTIMPLLIKYWRKVGKNPGPEDRLQTREFRSVTEGVVKLQKRFDYSEDPDLLDACLLYYWPLHYQQALSILGELPTPPHRVLDVYSGLAPMSFAALRHGAGEVIAADPMLDLPAHGAKICGQYGMTLTPRKWNPLKGACPVEGKFDLIIVGHILQSRVSSPEEYFSLIKKLTQLLTDDGMLVLIERSDNAINQSVLKLRDLLVNDGYPIQAPCVWKGNCPALQAKSVCYAQREYEIHPLLKEFQRSAKINLGSLKMSYLIAKNPKSEWPKLTHSPAYRIISPPFESFRGKSYYLCGTDGKKKLTSALEKHPKPSRAFDYLKRGELISFEDASGDRDYEVSENTKIKIEAALGKPLPSEEKDDFGDEW